MTVLSAYKTVDGNDWTSVGRVMRASIVGPDATLWSTLQRTYTVGSTVVHDPTAEANVQSNFNPDHRYPSIAGLHCWVDGSGPSGGALAAAHQVKHNITTGVGRVIRVEYDPAVDVLRAGGDEAGMPNGLAVRIVYLSTCVVAEEIAP
jgi:hypothetical protein